MSPAARYFIPVCLYPHTKYRTHAGMADLFHKYALRSHEYLIVIADQLLVLDRLVTGRYWSIASATRKARQEAEQVFRLTKRVAHRAGAQSSGRIVYWNEIVETAQFSGFANRLRQAVLNDNVLSCKIDEFVIRRVTRFGLGAAPERERDYEREYIISELCMSIFCTEVLGFSNEVWERPPAADIPTR